MVTRLSRIFEVDGVISNAPGPLNLKERCEREINNEIERSQPCSLLTENFGSVLDFPREYIERSLLSQINGFKSKILFTQGLQDADIQLDFWPVLKSKVSACQDCQGYEFIEFANRGHPALFTDPKGVEIVREFLDRQ